MTLHAYPAGCALSYELAGVDLLRLLTTARDLPVRSEASIGLSAALVIALCPQRLIRNQQRRTDMTAPRQLHLGAILEGVGTDQNGWRDPELPGDASIDIDWYIANARAAEQSLFDLVFIVDSPFITPDTAPHFLNRLEPLTLLSAIATHTSHIGLVGTLTTSYWEPYNVARQFGSLDHISRGRAGWNVVTTGLEGAARNYSRD
jgi:hypothetical protein